MSKLLRESAAARAAIANSSRISWDIPPPNISLEQTAREIPSGFVKVGDPLIWPSSREGRSAAQRGDVPRFG